MKLNTKLKRPILLGIIAVFLLLSGGLLCLLPGPKEPDPRALLSKADTLSEQNLCLLAILEEQPEDQESWRMLLGNYQRLGVDPLVLEATKTASGLDLTLPEGTVQPEEPGPLSGTGGICHQGRKITACDCYSLVTDGETLYLAREDGIYARYHGLERKITPAKAERMYATENGLYFLNALEKRVQYIARDGHRTETLSPHSAVDFAFLREDLWIAGTDGNLYQGEKAIDLSARELCVMGDTLYAVTEEGIVRVGEQTELLLPSPAGNLTAGGDVLYYVDENGYPARFDPLKMEATILKEKEARALAYDGEKLYYLNEKGKIKRIKKK